MMKAAIEVMKSSEQTGSSPTLSMIIDLAARARELFLAIISPHPPSNSPPR